MASQSGPDRDAILAEMQVQSPAPTTSMHRRSMPVDGDLRPTSDRATDRRARTRQRIASGVEMKRDRRGRGFRALRGERVLRASDGGPATAAECDDGRYHKREEEQSRDAPAGSRDPARKDRSLGPQASPPGSDHARTISCGARSVDCDRYLNRGQSAPFYGSRRRQAELVMHLRRPDGQLIERREPRRCRQWLPSTADTLAGGRSLVGVVALSSISPTREGGIRCMQS
jgi:hypothetical protein